MNRKKPQYVYSHICVKRDGMWMVFEKDKKFLRRPIAMGTTQGEAIENASHVKGVKHYMIEVVKE